jgi:hypothetical protein
MEMKDVTAEVAEHAEVEMPKTSRPRVQEKKGTEQMKYAENDFSF